MNKRNIVTTTIGMCFLVAKYYVVNLSFCTSKPSDHNFINSGLEKIEATIIEMDKLEEKARRHTKAVYREVLKFY